ncbi:MAG: hypothetical protein WKG52_01050 [Variovorax sp.]
MPMRPAAHFDHFDLLISNLLNNTIHNTMTAQNFIPTADAAALTQRSSAALKACGELLNEIMRVLPIEKKEALRLLSVGGGSVGIEALVDHAGVPKIHLVGIEREGSRHVLATVSSGNGSVH